MTAGIIQSGFYPNGNRHFVLGILPWSPTRISVREADRRLAAMGETVPFLHTPHEPMILLKDRMLNFLWIFVSGEVASFFPFVFIGNENGMMYYVLHAIVPIFPAGLCSILGEAPPSNIVEKAKRVGLGILFGGGFSFLVEVLPYLLEGKQLQSSSLDKALNSTL